jgi:hypothetical protein
MLGSIGPSELGFLAALAIFLIPGVFLLPTIFYLLTLQKALYKCSPENRTIPPGQVWLYLIPLFSLVWHFILIKHVADSLGKEFQKRGVVVEPRPGYELGFAMCVLNVTGLVPLLGAVTAIAGFVCWIVYWVKIHQFSKRLGD